MTNLTQRHRRAHRHVTDTEFDSTIRPLRVAFYERVSTDEQADRGTIAAQEEHLQHRFAADSGPLAPIPMVYVGTYADDGYSGTIPLVDRPDGRRLLDDCAAGKIDVVYLYRLDRLGRKLKVLVEAHERLERHNVAITSVTEPFDTRPGPNQAFGKFLFHLLAALAEMEIETIKMRTRNGKKRITGEGKFINGGIPLGYDIDGDGRLVPSERPIPELGMTESDLVRHLFEEVAGGTSYSALAEWLESSGFPCQRRFWNGRENRVRYGEPSPWHPARVWYIVNNETYTGTRSIDFNDGAETVTQAVVPLVSKEKQQRAVQRATQKHPRNHGHIYLLGARLVCDNETPDGSRCGYGFSGSIVQGKYRYYNCGGHQAPAARRRGGWRCTMPTVPADQLEELVLDDLEALCLDPGKAIERLQAVVRERQSQSTQYMEKRAALLKRRSAAEANRAALRREGNSGTRSHEEVEEDLAESGRFIADINAQLAEIDAAMDIDHSLEQRLTESAPMLRRLRDDLHALRESGDREELRRRLEGVIAKISVRKGADGKPTYRVHYRFMPEVRASDGQEFVTVRASDGRSSTTVNHAKPSGLAVDVDLLAIRRTRRAA
jgi:site-specific DNA recombinase